jgi:glycolate oxidase iron-sulfur subunit
MPIAELRSIEGELARCNRCGFCQPVCPTFRVTGVETKVARGRNVLVRNLLDGRLPLDRALDDPLFECLACRACVDVCQGKVRVDQIMMAARADYLQEQGLTAVQRMIFRNLLQEPGKVDRYAKLLAIGKRSGLSRLAKGLGLLRIVSKKLSDAEDLVVSLPSTFFRERVGGLKLRPDEPRIRVAYFVGCGTNLGMPEVGESVVKALVGCGAEVLIPDHLCCGLPPATYGDLVAARQLALKNLAFFRDVQADAIVTDCASCSAFLKEYPHLLTGLDAQEEADRFAARVRDFNELLLEVGPPQRLVPRETAVTFHDPCHLNRYQGIVQEPRALLEAIPGVELREHVEHDWCCGGAGSFNISHREMSMRILDRKMAHIADVNVPIVATCCPACIVQLRYGARRQGMDVAVKHVAELLADSITMP